MGICSIVLENHGQGWRFSGVKALFDRGRSVCVSAQLRLRLHLRQTLPPAHRATLPRLDQALLPFPWQAAPARGRGIPMAPGPNVRLIARGRQAPTHVRNGALCAMAAVGRGPTPTVPAWMAAVAAQQPLVEGTTATARRMRPIRSQLSASSTSSFNSVLASVRSGTSKPSVNQP